MADDKTKTTPTVKGLGKEQGQSGTAIFSGIISGEEYNAKLSNSITANRVYETMRRSDATVRSTLQVCKLPLLSAEWYVEPASEDKADIEIAEFINRELFERNINFHNFMREGLTMFDFGYSVAEKTYEMTEYNNKTRIGVKKIGFRKQKTIQAWETVDGKPGVTQMLVSGPAATVSIIREKLIIFTNDKEGDNDEGISLLRYAYKHWDIKDKLDLVNAIALEKLGIGVPIVEVPPDADPQDIAAVEDAMRQFRGNEEGYHKMPVGWKMEMLDLKGNSTKDVLPSVQYHDRQIQVSVLAQFLSLGGSEASGSRAVSQDHSKLFLLSEESAAKNLQSTIQDQLVKQLCDLNFTELPNGYPQLKFSKIGDEDASALATNVKELLAAGAITYDPGLEVYLRKVLRLPDLPEDIRKQFEEDLAETLKAKKTAQKTQPDTKKEDPSLEDDDDEIDVEEQKKDVEASAIANLEKATRKAIDILVA